MDQCSSRGAAARGRLRGGSQERGHPLQAHEQDQAQQYTKVQGKGILHIVDDLAASNILKCHNRKKADIIYQSKKNQQMLAL